MCGFQKTQLLRDGGLCYKQESSGFAFQPGRQNDEFSSRHNLADLIAQEKYFMSSFEVFRKRMFMLCSVESGQFLTGIDCRL